MIYTGESSSLRNVTAITGSNITVKAISLNVFSGVVTLYVVLIGGKLPNNSQGS